MIDGLSFIYGVVLVLLLPLSVVLLNKRRRSLGWLFLAIVLGSIGVVNLVLTGRVIP